MDVGELLGKRAQTHGDFEDNARYSQSLRKIFRSSPSLWYSLPDRDREALDMIATKIGRIISSARSDPQHWEDIEGYARLVINGKERAHGETTE